MGREIRMVPPNWQHPFSSEYGAPRLQPMYDQTFEEAALEWKEGFSKWEAGERPSYWSEGDTNEYWEWESMPPKSEYYRPYSDDEATWFQVWETVSEGTPVSPPFETQDELISYLAEKGDFWDQERCMNAMDCRLFGLQYGKSGWGMDAATKFVKSRWAPSMVVQNGVVTEGKLA